MAAVRLKKWDIRKKIDPQLRELWKVNHVLRQLETRRYWPKGGGWLIEGHHSNESPEHNHKGPDSIDLIEEIPKGGRSFLPLVRDSLLLVCGLKILFLRKEKPGKIYIGGDIDNRIKVFLDRLCVPSHSDSVIKSDESITDPIYCLLEDDGLISNISVETHSLLSGGDCSDSDVKMIVEVDVRATRFTAYNSVFLGE
jgi:hypothetical protein